MMDNMAAFVFLGSGPQAKSTHEYISETLGNATADKKDDRMSFGVNSSSDLSYSKAELADDTRAGKKNAADRVHYFFRVETADI